MRWLAGILVVAITVLAFAHILRRPDPLPGFPRVVLWAWDRPEDLRFLDSSRAGVAFLARNVILRHGHVESLPRLQPLQVPPTAALMAVVRLDSDGTPLPPGSVVIPGILDTVRLPGVKALQIDFDARLSQRAWYAALLRDLRKSLAPNIPLSITALASWCESDDWIAPLPVADAVPMVFRMGIGQQWNGADFGPRVCRTSIGVATDELPARVPRGRRLFFFNPGPWTRSAYEGALAQARRWQ